MRSVEKPSDQCLASNCTAWSKPDTCSLCPKYTPDEQGFPGKQSLPTALFKAVRGTRAALEVATHKRSDEGVAQPFQNLLAFIIKSFLQKGGVAISQDLL